MRNVKDGRGGGEAGKNRGGRKSTLVMGVPQLKFDLIALGILTDEKKPSVETTEGLETSCSLYNGIRQWFGLWVSVMGPRTTGF